MNPEETGKITEVIGEGEFYGMRTFDQSLLGYVMEGKISEEVALDYASSPHDFKLMLAAGGQRASGIEQLAAQPVVSSTGVQSGAGRLRAFLKLHAPRDDQPAMTTVDQLRSRLRALRRSERRHGSAHRPLRDDRRHGAGQRRGALLGQRPAGIAPRPRLQGSDRRGRRRSEHRPAASQPIPKQPQRGQTVHRPGRRNPDRLRGLVSVHRCRNGRWRHLHLQGQRLQHDGRR